MPVARHVAQHHQGREPLSGFALTQSAEAAAAPADEAVLPDKQQQLEQRAAEMLQQLQQKLQQDMATWVRDEQLKLQRSCQSQQQPGMPLQSAGAKRGIGLFLPAATAPHVSTCVAAVTAAAQAASDSNPQMLADATAMEQ